MAIYFPNFRARAGAARTRHKPRPGFFASGTLFPQLSRPGGRRPDSAQAEAGLFCRRSSDRRTQPTLRWVLCGILAFVRRSRTKVRFAPLLSQSARLKPILADIFCECESSLNFCARAGATCPKPYRATKMPASLRAFCFTVCDRRGRTPSTLRRRTHRSYNAAEWWDCCSCAPERDR